MIFLFTSDQYEMLYIYFFFSLQPPKILLEHVSMHMIKRKCNMYMEDREWEAIKQSEDKGMKEILGLEDYGQKMTDITKEYLNTIWIEKIEQKGTEK